MLQQTRRTFLMSSVSACFASGSLANASTAPRDLSWKDLLPRQARGLSSNTAPLSHSTIPSRSFSDPRHFAIVPQLNGQLIRLPGYLVPLEFDSLGGVEFLLVPFVGACIHVPPPPPNQLVYAVTDQPHQMTGLFDPVYAVGTLRTRYEPTELASASYSMDVERFEAVEF